MNNISAKDFIRNIDIEKTPWLYEDYINAICRGKKIFIQNLEDC